MQNRTRTSNSEGMLRVRGNHKYKTCGICWALLVVMFSSASVADDPFISLFDGKTLDGWVTLDDQPITKGWEVVDGTIHLKVEKERSGYIKTTRTFENFELEFEWRIAQGGNSGVYLQNRYEIQVLDGDATPHGMGAVINESESPYFAYNGLGEWNAYDIIFKAARFKDGKLFEKAKVSMVFNGVLVHKDRSIEKVWGGRNSGIDGGNDGGKGITDVPGGLKLQCEGHEVLFRNAWIQELKLDGKDTSFPSK